jgi:integrase
MNALKPTTVERFISKLRAKGLSPSTVRQIYTVARAIGDAAVRDGLLGKNPFTAVRRPKVTSAEAKFLEAAQIHRLLKSADSSRYGPFFEFLLNTGLRRGEALAWKWSDIDMDNQLLRVRGTLARVDGDLRVTDPKSEKSRRAVPISAPALAVLERVRERTAHDRSAARQVWRETGFVFVTDIGEPCDPATPCVPSIPQPARLG